jgi:hypothetical protein
MKRYRQGGARCAGRAAQDKSKEAHRSARGLHLPVETRRILSHPSYRAVGWTFFETFVYNPAVFRAQCWAALDETAQPTDFGVSAQVTKLHRAVVVNSG